MVALNLPHDNIQDHTCKNHQNHEHLAVQAQIILMNWRLAQGLLWYKNVACCTHDSLRHTDVAQANKLNHSLHNVVLHVRGQRRMGEWNIANFFNGLFVPVGLCCSEILLFSHPVTIQKHVQHVAKHSVSVSWKSFGAKVCWVPSGPNRFDLDLPRLGHVLNPQEFSLNVPQSACSQLVRNLATSTVVDIYSCYSTLWKKHKLQNVFQIQRLNGTWNQRVIFWFCRRQGNTMLISGRRMDKLSAHRMLSRRGGSRILVSTPICVTETLNFWCHLVPRHAHAKGQTKRYHIRPWTFPETRSHAILDIRSNDQGCAMPGQ